MSGSEGAELAAAVRALEELPRKAKPHRHHARAVLVPLGVWVLAEGEAGAREGLERVRRAVARFGAAWEAAVRDELTLACTEHVQSIDARYLALPNYDLDYTLEARERLEARLAAARALGIELQAPLRDRVDRADRALADHLARVGRAPDRGASSERDAGPDGITPGSR
jgi:hypothetical protein